MSRVPYLNMTGPADDLEVLNYTKIGHTFLPDPQGDIPFYVQGKPIPDPYQVHTQPPQITQATTYCDNNPLPFTRFVGTFTRQINQPGFLSVNEDIYLE